MTVSGKNGLRFALPAVMLCSLLNAVPVSAEGSDPAPAATATPTVEPTATPAATPSETVAPEEPEPLKMAAPASSAAADDHLFADLGFQELAGDGDTVIGIPDLSFNPGTFEYNVSVAAGVDRLGARFTLMNSEDLISINDGTPEASKGDQSFEDLWYLAFGTNTRTFTVTAADQSVAHTYTVNVTRESKGTLADLKLNVGDPFTFEPHALYYSVSVGYSVDQAVINYARSEAGSKVKLNGGDDKGDTASQPLALHYGSNRFTVEVTSADGTVDTLYTIFVERDYLPVKGDQGEVPAVTVDGNEATIDVLSSDALNLDLNKLFGIAGYTNAEVTSEENGDLGSDLTDVKVDAGTTTITATGADGTTYTVTINKPLEMLDGTGSGLAHAKGSKDVLSFHCNGSDQKYTGIKVDGKDATRYAAVSHGSTIVTLDSGFLNSLETGSHTLTIEYGKYSNEDFQSIDSKFVITEQQPVQAGQSADRYWLITYLDSNGNTVSVQWVRNGGSPVKPAGYSYPDISNVTSNQDVRPIGGASASGRISVPNTADTGD